MNEAAMANMEVFGFVIVGIGFFLFCAILFGLVKLITTPTGKAILFGALQTMVWICVGFWALYYFL